MTGIIEFKDGDLSVDYLKKVGIEYRYDCYQNLVPDGCHRLADFLEAFEKDIVKARTVYLKNCDENKHAHSCLKIGNYEMLGKGGAMNLEDAYKHYKIACEQGNSAACTNGSLMHDAGKLPCSDFVESASLLEIGCHRHDDVACCQQLSTYYISGKAGIGVDFARAFRLAEKACLGGHMYACANLAQMYKRGDGITKDLKQFEYYKARAKRLYREATNPEADEIKMGQ